LTRAFPSAGEDDLVVLQADPYCEEPYSGRYQSATVFVVGYATEHEALFTRKQRTEALDYARSKKLTFDGVVARECCHHVMVELLGG
jgi:hypothetical protein